jgi:hypothetical protein
MGRGEDGEVRGCQRRPDEGSECSEIHADALYLHVAARLEREGIDTIGIGRGPCGDTRGDYDAWNFAIAVDDWAHADAAVRALAETFSEWDARGPAGVAVRAIPCGAAD